MGEIPYSNEKHYKQERFSVTSQHLSEFNNENEKAMINGMLPDGNESMIDSTTMFSSGDVLVVGDAAPIPLIRRR